MIQVNRCLTAKGILNRVGRARRIQGGFGALRNRRLDRLARVQEWIDTGILFHNHHRFFGRWRLHPAGRRQLVNAYIIGIQFFNGGNIVVVIVVRLAPHEPD